MPTPRTAAPTLALLALTFAAAAQDIPPDLLHDRLPLGAPDDSILTDLADSRDVALADLDLDGFLDVLVANMGADNSLYWGDGTGQFVKQLTGDIVGDRGDSRGLALGDVDLDGDLDVYVTNSLGQQNFLYVNQAIEGASRTFVKVTTDPSVMDPLPSRQAAFADVDGDGDDDLFVTNWMGADDQLFLSLAKDTAPTAPPYFVKATPAQAGDAVTDGAFSFGLAFADIDADDDLDLFVAYHSGILHGPKVKNGLYTNDGNGHFTRVTTGDAANDVGNSLAVAFGDHDGDGDPDLFVGRVKGEKNSFYRNDGGQLTSMGIPRLTSDRGETIDADLVDVDRDGDVDLLCANRRGHPNLLYLNIGKGSFREQAFGPITEDLGESYAFAVGDINGDLTLDIFLANLMEENTVYRNFGRQWSDLGGAIDGTNGLPRLGAAGNLLPDEEIFFDGHFCKSNSLAMLIVSPIVAPIPFMGIPLIPEVSPTLSNVVFTTTDGSGQFLLDGRMPPGVPPLTQLFVQTIVLDDSGMPASGFTAAATNALRATTP
jgi:hypothetical protein